MISVLPKDVVGLAPEFASLAATDDGAVQMATIITYAREMVAEARWGSKAKMGICLMAAHLLKDLGFGDGGTSGAAGPITMEKVGDLQRSYGALQVQGGSVGDQMIATTKYGKNFVMLKKTIPTTPLVL